MMIHLIEPWPIVWNNPTVFHAYALKPLKRLIERKFLHLDTTSMSVQGEYKFEDEDMVPIQITNGHANKRYDWISSSYSISSSHADFFMDERFKWHIFR